HGLFSVDARLCPRYTLEAAMPFDAKLLYITPTAPPLSIRARTGSEIAKRRHAGDPSPRPDVYSPQRRRTPWRRRRDTRPRLMIAGTGQARARGGPRSARATTSGR